MRRNQTWIPLIALLLTAALASPLCAAAPAIASVSPSTALAGGPGFTLLVKGSGFSAGCYIMWSGNSLNTQTSSATDASAIVANNLLYLPGTNDIVMRCGSEDSAPTPLTVAAPTPVLTGANREALPLDGNTSYLLVAGTGFGPYSKGYWNGQPVPTYSESATYATLTIAPELKPSIGAYSVTVVNEGNPTSSNALTVRVEIPPTLAGVSPDAVPAGSPVTQFTITGTNLCATGRVSFRGQSYAIDSGSDTALQFTAPASALSATGTYQVIVYCRGASSTNSVPIHVTGKPPVITFIDNKSFLTADGVYLTIYGTLGYGGKVLLGDTQLPVASFGYTYATVRIPASSIPARGAYSVRYMNVDGTISNAVEVTITTSASLASRGTVYVGSSAKLQVDVSDYLPGDRCYWLRDGSEVALPPPVLLPSQTSGYRSFEVELPAALLNQEGSASIIVRGANGFAAQSALPISILPPPRITSIEPSHIAASTGFVTLTVSGVSLSYWCKGEWNGVPMGRPSDYDFSTFRVMTPSDALKTPGTAKISATCGTAVSNEVTFTIDPGVLSAERVAVAPNATAGSDKVLTVTGWGFDATTKASFAGQNLTVTPVNYTTIQVALPGALTRLGGRFKLALSRADGSAAEAQFTLLGEVTSVDVGPAASDGSRPITITGRGFPAGSRARISVVGNQFDSEPLNGDVTPTSIIGSIPSQFIRRLTQPKIGVLVYCPDVLPVIIVTLPDAPPIINSVSPDSAHAGDSAMEITVTGSGFVAGSKVRASGADLVTAYVSSTQLKATLPTSQLASRTTLTITVGNPDGAISSNTRFAVTAPIPIVTEITPSQVTAGSGDNYTIEIRGSQFLSNVSVRLDSSYGSIMWPTVVSVEPSRIVVKISQKSLAAGVYEIRVSNPDDQYATPVQFKVLATLTSISPSSIPAGSADTILTLTGEGLSGVVMWNGTELSPYISGSGRFQVIAPAALLLQEGVFPVSVRTAVNTLTLNVTVTSGSPSILNVLPSHLPAGGPDTTVDVNGVRFQAGCAVYLDGIALATTRVSDTTAQVLIPASMIAKARSVKLVVKNPDGGSSEFTINAYPTITTITPNEVTVVDRSKPIRVTINGIGFANPTLVCVSDANSRVVDRLFCVNADYVDAQTLTATFSDLAFLNSRHAALVSAGNSSQVEFWYGRLLLTSVEPAVIAPGSSDTTITVRGEALSNCILRLNGSELAILTRGDNQITAMVPGSLLGAATTFNLTAFLDPLESRPITLTVGTGAPAAAKPAISSITPNALVWGIEESVELRGSGFTQQSRVHWEGLDSEDLATTYQNDSRLRAVVPARALREPGVATITVVNPDGQTSAGITLRIADYSTATLLSLEPSSITAGSGDFTLTIHGFHFSKNTTVSLNAATVPATVNAARDTATANIPASAVATAGRFSVAVQNSGEVTRSNTLPFTVNPVPLTITAMRPQYALAGSANSTLTIAGTGMKAVELVYWDGQRITPVSVSSTELTLPLPSLTDPANMGLHRIRVSDRTRDAVATFPIVPVIKSLSRSELTSAEVRGGTAVRYEGIGLAERQEICLARASDKSGERCGNGLGVAGSVQLNALAGDLRSAVLYAGSGNGAYALVRLAIGRPSISSITPASIAAGSGDTVATLTGEDLTGATIYLNGAVANFSIVDNTHATVVIPASRLAASGVHTFRARVDDLESNSATLAVTGTPTSGGVSITQLSPATAKAGAAALTLTITGSAFVSGAVAYWDGAALSTAFQSANRISAVVPAELLAKAGQHWVTVGDPAGSTSSALPFSVSAQLIRITPDSVRAGADAQITLLGVGFGAQEQLCVSSVSGAAPSCFNATWQSATSAIVSIPARVLTVRRVAAVYLAGADTGAESLPLSIGLPVIEALSPDTAPAGSAAINVTITGKELADAVFKADGEALTVSSSSGNTQAAVELPASALANARSISITATQDSLVSKPAIFLVASADGKPLLNSESVVNAASYKPQLAPGGLISIFGSSLAANKEEAKIMPLPETLQNVVVLVNGQRAPLLFVSPTQINAQLPYETPDGPAILEVRNNGKSSGNISIVVLPSAVGVIYNIETSQAIAQNLDWTLNSPEHPAKPGDWAIVYVTGLGAVNGAVRTGEPTPADRQYSPIAAVSATLGGVPVKNIVAALSPGFAGLAQVNIQIPEIAAGQQPLVITAGGVIANTALISVGPK